MNSFKYSLTALLVLLNTCLFSQDNKLFINNLGQNTGKQPDMNDFLFNEVKQDYRIISSGATYLEIEYIPSGVYEKKFSFNNENFSVIEFLYGLDKTINSSGSPDLKYRSFPVFLPSEINNSVQVIDYEMKEEQNINIAPVPVMSVFNPNVRSFENIYYNYLKNGEFQQNKYLPENFVSLSNIGPLRDAVTGNLVIYPFQYNPVTKSLRYYSRLRIRITFGETPVQLNRARSKEEISLLSGAGINFNTAAGWMNPKLRNIKRDRLVTNSVLSSGDWYKLEIKDNADGTSEGIYKITKSFLDNAGINTSGIDPRTFKIYGNGGNYLPEFFGDPRPEDLVENAIYIEGENDGVFNNDDYILFYGRSINQWIYDSTARTFNHRLNVYSRSNYYWIAFNTPNNGKRMMLSPSDPGNASVFPTSFTEKLFIEPEVENLINEGNLWLSSSRRPGQSFEWNTNLNGLEAGSDIFYRLKLAQRVLCPNSGYFQVKDDFSNMSEFLFSLDCVVAGFNEWINTQARTFTINQSQKTNGEQVKLRATFYASNSEAEGYQDWFEILYKRRFNSASGDFLRFNSPDTNAIVEYNVSSFSNNNIRVFDATGHADVKLIQPVQVSASNVKFRKTEINGSLSSFIIVGQNGYKTPTSISSRVSNQNLRGISDGASFIIVTHKDFISVGERLKNKREQGGQGNPDYLKTMVVTTEQIFNEFSGGVYDAVAIRDFIKYAYENWTTKPAYVCLLGDGSFDYKGLRPSSGINYVPAWEKTDPQIHQVLGLTTDDFFVNIAGGSGLIDKPDLAIGRIPANSLVEANNYIDKIDAYESGEHNGYWKNKMMFVADDEKTTSPGCEGIFHLLQCESLAEQYTPPYIDKLKIYLATYPTVITPQGRRKPQVNEDIAKYWTDGVLNIHYTGHGSPDVWAHEYVLEKDVILSLINNTNRYPFVSIASCDMSKFDNPSNTSAGELFMIANRKGAIGTLAASRPVYASSNAALMYVVFSNLYIPRDTLLLQKRFGAAIFNTKQQIQYSENDAKYILMCDPTIRTQMPRFRSHIDSISGLAGDTMKALSRIKIYGSVLRADSSVWNDYNGKLVLKIYDVDRNVATQEDCNPPIIQNFRLNGGIIYSGTKNVNNGKWTAEFIVPKDISYQNNQGRLINYFYNNQYDGAGINRNFIVGGINPNAAVDSIGPRISMFMNTRNFRSGDIVNENSKFIADLFDESGINTTGTLGHKLEAVLDGNENNKYDLTNFYNSDTTYTSGTLEYDFTNLTVGRHTLKLKAWDTYNNSNEATIEFDVASTGSLQVTNIYNYPNPFAGNTAFTFQHNYPAEINVKIKVYTVAGRLIKEIDKPGVSDKFVVIDWDGKDQDGETLGNGVYIYKLVVESVDGLSVTNTGKLAVLK
ncbi:MAG: periplasmic ligand-binding sensor domain-containing protein [Chlorobi bacterium OLB5]|nr:MAG: periplasmic ligand-binding sensor domain-containing protein [Chlorobi bacterium OLB5]